MDQDSGAEVEVVVERRHSSNMVDLSLQRYKLHNCSPVDVCLVPCAASLPMLASFDDFPVFYEFFRCQK